MPTAFIDIEDTTQKSVIVKSLLPEIKIPRANIHLSSDNNTVRLEIKTHDAISLRAACNSLLRWIDVVAQIQGLVNECK